MQKIVLEEPKQSIITLNNLKVELFSNNYNLKGRVILYKRHSTSNYAILTKLIERKWGFVSIGELDSKPCYVSSSIADSIELVIKAKRDIRIFSSIHEFSKEVLAGNYA